MSAVVDDRAVGQLLAGYRRIVRRHVLWLLLLLLLLVGAVLLDLVTGPSDLRPWQVIEGLLRIDPLGGAQASIVWMIRLPTALMAILVGCSLGLAGAEMQTTLDNPLASPFTLGVSSSSSFGAALAIVLDITIPGVPATWVIPANAFVFAFSSLLLLQALGRWRGGGNGTLVLFGIAIVYVFQALVALLQFMADADNLQQIVFWTMGTLAGRASWPKLAIMAVVFALVIPFSFLAASRMTALRFGDDRARSLGVSVERLRFWTLLRVSLLTAIAVAFVGPIGFVGLVGPHIARLLVGEDHRFYLPASALTGALMLSLSSIVGKCIIPGVLVPVGVITALIGVPFFLALIIARRGDKA